MQMFSTFPDEWAERSILGELMTAKCITINIVRDVLRRRSLTLFGRPIATR